MPEKTTSGSRVEQAAEKQCIDLDTLEAQVDEVLNEELYWFPVRHHSPTAARFVEEAIRKRKPKLLFIEAPSDATALIPHIVDKATRPPVAIYSSYRDDDNVLGLAGIESPNEDIPARFSSWYPLLQYSPEYAAMKAATKIGCEIIFVDLPHYALIRPHCERDKEDEIPQDDPDHLIEASDFYSELAKSAGYRTWDEAWDSLFEFGRYAQEREAFRRELATFCAAARATTPTQRMLTDGTIEREAHMHAIVRKALTDRELNDADAMVVCGGFHLFMDRTEDADINELPAGTVYSSVVPYSYFRISDLAGYAAGNRAPQFYQSYWEHCKKGTPENLLPSHVVAVLRRTRQTGEAASVADAISVTQHAAMLANLRRRETPILDDIHDALITCCCKGNPEDEGIHLRKAMDAVDIGRAIGRVTPKIGWLPIVIDFHNCIDQLDLGELLEEERVISLNLDKREELDHRRSAFLHRLRYLKIPVATLSDSRNHAFGNAALFSERWQLKWTPRVEPGLIEENLYGDTIESASLAKLRENLAKDSSNAGKCCEILRYAMDMDLPGLISKLQDQCSATVANDSRLVSLATALHNLQIINKYAAFRRVRRDLIDELIRQCYDRACFAIPASASVPEKEQENVINALRILAEAVFQDGSDMMDPELFARYVETAAGDTKVPFLKGAFYGLLAELKVMTSDEVAELLAAYSRAAVEIMIKAGDFLDGVLAVSRTSILLGADSLIAAIEELLRAADHESFLTMIPRIRAAFERLHERQRDSIARRVAERHGLKKIEQLTDLRTSFGAALLIARIDQKVDEIMQKWEF